jgi:hypothetical protein
MSNQTNKGIILQPLQRRIVLCLAEEGLQTINEITKSIPRLKLAEACHYKPTWLALKWLREKGLIKEAGIKEYRGRKYPQFWLTDDGAYVALAEGASLNNLLAKAKQIYPDNKNLICYLKIASKLNPEAIRVIYSSISKKGKLEPVDLNTIFFTLLQTEATVQTWVEIIDILREYPEEYVTFKKRMGKIQKKLNKFINMTQKTNQ